MASRSQGHSSANVPNKTEEKFFKDEESQHNSILHEDFEDEAENTPKKSSKKQIFCMIFTIFLFSSPFILYSSSKTFRVYFGQLGEEIRSLHGSTEGYLLILGIGTALLLCCLPSMYFEIIIGFALKNFIAAFTVAMIYRVGTMSIIYLLSRTLLHERVHQMAENSHNFFAMKYLARLKPWTTLFMIRFSYVPPGIINYGLPLLGYSFTEYIFAGSLAAAFYIMTNTSLGLAARSIEEIETNNFTDGPEYMRKLPLFTSLLGFIVIIFLCRYTKKRLQAITKRYSLRRLKEKVVDPNLSYGALEGL